MADNQSIRVCDIDGCEKPFAAKGWCSYHYKRAHATGSPTTPRKKRSPNPEATRRKPCSVPGCATIVGPTGARGYCATHYSRWWRTGQTGVAGRLTASREGLCGVPGCGRDISATGLCRLHKNRLAASGTVEKRCLHCGADMTNRARARSFCNAAHAAMYRRHGGARPESRDCARCGAAFSLLATGKAGRAKRTDAKMCPECRKARQTRHGWSVKALVALHGSTDCGICGAPVDLTLQAPNMMRPSIDHIVPFAHGGSNDPENLQLAHLHCNHVKSDSGYKRGRRVTA